MSKSNNITPKQYAWMQLRVRTDYKSRNNGQCAHVEEFMNEIMNRFFVAQSPLRKRVSTAIAAVRKQKMRFWLGPVLLDETPVAAAEAAIDAWNKPYHDAARERMMKYAE